MKHAPERTIHNVPIPFGGQGARYPMLTGWAGTSTLDKIEYALIDIQEARNGFRDRRMYASQVACLIERAQHALADAAAELAIQYGD